MIVNTLSPSPATQSRHQHRYLTCSALAKWSYHSSSLGRDTFVPTTRPCVASSLTWRRNSSFRGVLSRSLGTQLVLLLDSDLHFYLSPTERGPSFTLSAGPQYLLRSPSLFWHQLEDTIQLLEFQLRATALVVRVLLDISVARALLAPHPWLAATSFLLVQDPPLLLFRLELLVLAHGSKHPALELAWYSSPRPTSRSFSSAWATHAMPRLCSSIHTHSQPW